MKIHGRSVFLVTILSLMVVSQIVDSMETSKDRNPEMEQLTITSDEEAEYQKFMKENPEQAKSILEAKQDVPKQGRSLALKATDDKKPPSKPVTKKVLCETCGELLGLSVKVDGESNPTWIRESLDCQNSDTGLPSNTDSIELSCGKGQRTIGLGFRFDFEEEDDKSNATEERDITKRYIKNLTLICSDDILDCKPKLGSNKLWGPNITSKPENSSLCVPGDALTGVDYTIKDDLIRDIRAICCTKALHPKCKFNFTQTLHKLVVAGEDFCTYCDRQKPVREELLQEHEDAVWYPRNYKDAIHYSFLRQLVGKPNPAYDIPLYKATDEEEFKNVKIDHLCPFGGTTLKPNTFFEFFVSAEERCGLPVYQRTFLALEHGIRFHTRTARLLTPGLKLYETPKTLGWMKAAGECFLDCEVKKDEL